MKESSSSKVLTPLVIRRKPNVIKVVKETPRKYHGSHTPLNAEEQKVNFLRYGIPPTFVLNRKHTESVLKTPQGKISSDLLAEAVRILEMVRAKFPSCEDFVERTYGQKITYRQGSALLSEYLHENKLDGQINIMWCNDLDCSGKMMWHGPNMRFNRPEARKHTLLIKNSPENVFQRKNGLLCLANHEIGTHFLRNLNDGLQPWYADRRKFGLRHTGCYESTVTEEGLAALHTLIEAKFKYLFHAALLYYTACMAEELTFKELFDHLEKYVQNPEQRWKLVMRVKRVLADPSGVGGYGKDQCYFEGAVTILRCVDNVDFPLLYSGKVCIDELDRVKRMARLDCIRLPYFMNDFSTYRKLLRQIGIVNKLITPRRRPSAKVKLMKTLPPLNKVNSAQDSPKKNTPQKKSAKAIKPIFSHTTESWSEKYMSESKTTLYNGYDLSQGMAIVESLDTKVGCDILVTVPFADVKFYDRALSPRMSVTPGLTPTKNISLGSVIKKLSPNEKAVIYTVLPEKTPKFNDERSSSAAGSDAESVIEINVSFHKHTATELPPSVLPLRK